MLSIGRKFRFLTIAEFNGLSAREKFAYLEGAMKELQGQKHDHEEHYLFEDGPPLTRNGEPALS